MILVAWYRTRPHSRGQRPVNGVRLSERFFRWHPDNWPGLTPDELLHFAVDVFDRVALHHTWAEAKVSKGVLWRCSTNSPVKYSPNSCSIFKARSWVFFACSSLMRRFISLWENQKVSASRTNGFGRLTLSIQRILVWWILRWDTVEPLGAVWSRCPKHPKYSVSFAAKIFLGYCLHLPTLGRISPSRRPLARSPPKFHKDCRYTTHGWKGV